MQLWKLKTFLEMVLSNPSKLYFLSVFGTSVFVNNRETKYANCLFEDCQKIYNQSHRQNFLKHRIDESCTVVLKLWLMPFKFSFQSTPPCPAQARLSISDDIFCACAWRLESNFHLLDLKKKI